MSLRQNEKIGAAIITQILQLFENNGVTARDTQKIIRATETILADVTIPVNVPTTIQWPSLQIRPTGLHRSANRNQAD